ncbi:hypothetical protein NSU_2170 [Novosphingobium pentaromativorans US6-1]|uniref:Uncharacterized protein n=1 Tax=Novosphingobium pentaromativorans US6-1 TaxID=1088721 RepID=G6ECU9_9SPHN|nr:hypothetical protein NSU_2170 [Novosphingobium pentaromativorans US6-1]
MRGKALGHWRGRLGAGPEAAIGALDLAQRRLGVAAQHGGQRAFVARRGTHRVDCDGQAMCGLGALGPGLAVANEGAVFAFDAGEVGTRAGEFRGRGIALGLQLCLAGLLCLKSLAGLGKGLSGSFGFRSCSGDDGVEVTRRLERADLRLQALCLGIEAGKPVPCLRQFGLGNAPFGLDAGLLGGRLRQFEFGGAGGAFGAFQGIGQTGAVRLVGCKLLFALGQFAFEAGKRLRRIAGHAVGIAAVFLEPGLLPLEIGQTLFCRFELAGERCHAVALRIGIVAAVGQFVTRFDQRFGSGGLGVLRQLRGLLRLIDAGLRGLGFLARGLCGSGGIAPAGIDEARLGQPDFVGEGLVLLGRPGLAAQRGDLLVEPGHDVFEAGKVGFGRAQLLLGVLAAHVEAGDASCFFQHRAAFGRFGGDDCGDLALTDQRGRMRAGRGVGEDQRHVLGAHVAAVDAIGAARPALDPAHDFKLFALAVDGGGLAGQDDFGEAARGAAGGAGEDHVFHAAAAHRLGRAFAHDPADRFEKVGLAAAVGADDAGQPRLDAQFGRLYEALESTELEPPYAHRVALIEARTGASARAGLLQLGFQLVPAHRTDRRAVDDERGRTGDVEFLRRLLGLVGKGLGLGGVGKAGLGLVECDPARGEEFGHARCLRDGRDLLRRRHCADGLELVLAQRLHVLEHVGLPGPELFAERDHRLGRPASGQQRGRHVVGVEHEVAQFVADAAAGDIVVAQLGEAFLGEFGAVRAAQRAIFDELDRCLGIAEAIAALVRLGDHVRPALAGGSGDRGDRLVRNRRGLVLLVAAGGQAEGERSGNQAQRDVTEAKTGHRSESFAN